MLRNTNIVYIFVFNEKLRGQMSETIRVNPLLFVQNIYIWFSSFVIQISALYKICYTYCARRNDRET